MSSDQDPTSVAESFANFVVKAKWAAILPLFSKSLVSEHTAESLADVLGWEVLGERLRQMHMEMSGEDEEMVPHLDPPERFEVYEEAEWDAPEEIEPDLGWVEVDFLPSEESEFDTCFNCFLAMVDEDGPKIAAFEIQLPD
ncbi:hypothetical protein GC170_11495 [bacterium]|nr:hypothetical protein [bacterium]